MLRVTIKKDNAVETWELEGKLSGEWVSELDRLWKQRSPQPGIATEIHLKAVSYIDPAGKQLLAEMRAHGAEIKGCGCMVRAFVEEIMRKKGTEEGLPKKILTIVLLAGFLLGGAAILCAEHRPLLELAVQNRVTAGHR
jgi:ABC-type transporter Mla MlaB component